MNPPNSGVSTSQIEMKLPVLRKSIAVAMFIMSLSSTPAIAMDFYVAPDGDDAAAGTLQAPLATIQGAPDKIREYRLDTQTLPDGGIDVHFRGGRYTFTSSTKMTAADSGETGKPITYQAYDNEEVIFDGSTALRSADFSLVTNPAELSRMGSGAAGNVYRLLINDSAIRTQLSKVNAVLDLDGKMAQVSRYPNVGNDHIASVLDGGAVYVPSRTLGDPPSYDMDNPIGAEFTLRENNAARWETEFQSVQKAQISGYPSNDWHKETDQIADINAGFIKLLKYSRYGVTPGTTRRLYILNFLCELDAPGEWWFDENTNVLYL